MVIKKTKKYDRKKATQNEIQVIILDLKKNNHSLILRTKCVDIYSCIRLQATI